jgi:hypothetical protein
VIGGLSSFKVPLVLLLYPRGDRVAKKISSRLP